ncbi:glycosyltransferase [Coleofasciculus chthonoplastes]|jgi:glycosyltransferase involved in cell wall biosynthesis|uniref:glycosyltransferase n=1 Tax=Coleofasciculus chthonoplastes TaxID=64178 RepID=UPI0032F6BD42
MPTISVIIPVYNGEKTIRETLESVFNQTFCDFEVIVINDGSQDSTLEILSAIKEPRLKIFSYPNANQAASRNRGLTHACGDYIAFLDADDLWTPDKLEAQFNALQENPQAAVAYSWTNVIDESGQFLRPGSHITVNGDAYPHLLMINFIENGSNPLIRRKALEEVGGFNTSLPLCEDRDMWLRLAARYPFVAVPSAQILYRVSSQSSSTNIFRLEAAGLQVIQQAFERVPEALIYLKPYSFGNMYKYLTFKALDGTPERHKTIVAAKFLYHAVTNDPSLLKTRVLWKVLLKIITATILPTQLAEQYYQNYTSLFNISAILVHIKRELPMT